MFTSGQIVRQGTAYILYGQLKPTIRLMPIGINLICELKLTYGYHNLTASCKVMISN